MIESLARRDHAHKQGRKYGSKSRDSCCRYRRKGGRSWNDHGAGNGETAGGRRRQGSWTREGTKLARGRKLGRNPTRRKRGQTLTRATNEVELRGSRFERVLVVVVVASAAPDRKLQEFPPRSSLSSGTSDHSSSRPNHAEP